MAASEASVKGLGTWVLAARPKTLVAAVVPVLVGTALAWADGVAHLGAAAVALLGAFLIQIGTNLTNDLYDFRRGADTAERIGPMRVTQAGLVTQRQMAAAIVLVFALAVGCGVYLTWRAGWPLLVVGLVSIASGVAYTAGPYPLAYRGLGDVFVFVFFGVVATVGAYGVQAQALGVWPALASVAVGLLATALLVVNNLRDVVGDAKVGKRTLAVRLGRKGTIVQYRLLLALSYVVPALLWWWGPFSLWVFLPLLSAPLAFLLWRDIARLEGAALNGVLAHTARLQLVFGALLALGVVL